MTKATSTTQAPADRRSVDLSAYPDLVVIYLGMRVNTLRGVMTLLGFGPRIAQSVKDAPDGLLLHEDLIFGLLPPHLGMRQYWRDFEALEAWSHSAPHREWWKRFMKRTGGVGIWHETYRLSGGFEAIYSNIPTPLGLLKFAPELPAEGAMASARQRLSGTDRSEPQA